MTLTEQIMKHFKSYPNQDVTVKELAVAFGSDSRTISTAIANASRRNKNPEWQRVIRTARGIYSYSPEASVKSYVHGGANESEWEAIEKVGAVVVLRGPDGLYAARPLKECLNA